MKNIQTQNADLNLVKKFLDYANCADASYAMLHYINKNEEKDINNNIFKADGLTFKGKLEKDINFKDENNKEYTKSKGTNTAYACAIEARFQKDKIIGKHYLLLDKTIDNDITQVKIDDELSQRTITFTNRFRILNHQENK